MKSKTPDDIVPSASFAITLVSDERGIDLAKFALASFFLSQDANIDAHLYCDGFQIDRKDPIFALARSRGFKLTAHEVSSRNFGTFKTARHITRTQFLKLVSVKDLLPVYDRVLYADIDLLFFHALDLAAVNFQGKRIAASFDVAEVSGITNADFAANCATHGLSVDYFNSGLILFNARAIDPDALERQYTDLIAAHQEGCRYKIPCRTFDQCVWNILFTNDWAFLPIAWNVQSSMRFTKAWRDATVRHYTGPKKFLPLASWRSDRREIALIKRISAKLRYATKRPVSPFGIGYTINSLRWAGGVKRISAAIDLVNARYTPATRALPSFTVSNATVDAARTRYSRRSPTG